MVLNRWKKQALALASVSFAVALLMTAVPARTAVQDDAGALYKTKCAACHGPAAEKKFDATRPDAELIEAVLKGKKPEKPPNMPGYEEKGITADQAKALVDFMKSQKH
jgi:mono/diheme cytochrome c family protein